MSSFVPINLAEDSASSKKELEEEHTREIQVEQAFSTFQRALAYQKQGSLLKANKLYEELFTLTVIGNHYFEEEAYLKGIQNGSMNHSVDSLNYVSQNVKLLRYLIFRNRGFLHLDLLLKGPDLVGQLIGDDEKDTKVCDKLKELFYTMVEDLTAAIIYQEGDEEVIELLYQVFVYLGLIRLVRFTLEYRLSGTEESDDVLGFLPVDSRSLQRYNNVLKQLHVSHSRQSHSHSVTDFETERQMINTKFAFLDDIRDEFKVQQHNTYKKQAIKVQLPSSTSISWLQVVEAIDHKAKSCQDKKKIADIVKIKLKYVDPYLFSETPQEVVEIEVPEVPETTHEQQQEKTEKTPPPETAAVELSKGKDDDIIEQTPELPATKEPLVDQEAKFTHRSSKRLAKNDSMGIEQIDYVISGKDFIESELFFQTFNQFLKQIDLLDKHMQISNIVDYYFSDEDDSNGTTTPQYISDFLTIIDDWTSSFSHCILENLSVSNGQDGTTENKKLLEILANYGNKVLIKDVPKDQKLDHVATYDSILDSLKAQPYRNLTDLKIGLLLKFFQPQNLNGNKVCLISDFQFNPKLMDIVNEWTLQLEPYVFEDLNRKLEAGTGTGIGTDIGVNELDLTTAVSFYEVLTDIYYTLRNKITDRKGTTTTKGAKVHMQILAMQAIKLKSRLQAWFKLIDNNIASLAQPFTSELLKQKGRFLWANICLEKLDTNNWKSTNYLVKLLSDILCFIQDKSQWLQLSNYNYGNIPTLNLENVNSMISTVSVLSVFAKIVYADSGNTESISVLESMLMDGELSERQSLKDFLETSSIDLKLNLWSILFDHYERDNELIKLQSGYESYVRFLFDYIQSQQYQDLPIKNRQLTLLTICNSFSESTSKFLESLEAVKLCLPLNKEAHVGTFLILLRFFELFYLFSLHEEAAILTPRKNSVLSVSKRSYARLKAFCIQLVSIIMIYYKNSNEAKVCEFMRVVHDQLGARRLCDSDHGRFLKYIQQILTSISSTTIPEQDLIQILHCRYHYNITCDTFTPENHETTEVEELDSPLAAEGICDFILPVFFKENPLIKPPKQDLKQLIEDLYSILGGPDFESNEILKRNKAVLNYFLDSERLSPRFFRETYYGLFTLEFEPVKSKNLLVMSGLYYLQALLIFSSYKLRKKSMQTRAVELESIVLLLETDLIYNSNRLESWLILGQVYGFLVEDDLIWTSDKLTYPERKVGTANLQRRSIICYLMAINASVGIPKNKKNYYKKVIGMLLASFAKELYSACMEPMNGHAFEVLANPKFVMNNGASSSSSFVTTSKNMVSLKTCLKLMKRSLQMSVVINDEDWTVFYYYAKVLQKMKHDPKQVLDILIKAGVLAKEQSTSTDRIIEPHYLLCAYSYKYVKSDSMNIQDALQYLKQSPIVELEHTKLDLDVAAATMTKPEFYKVIIECLNKVDNYDKKKWHHKARYRLAYIHYHEFGNVEAAMKEMGLFVSVKASNKTLVLIWKPENERPGKHFCYTFEYAMFYIDLLVKERNLNGLIQMLPKLRRSNSTMIKLYNAWERLCVAVCGLIRSLLHMNEAFTEVFLVRLSYKKFIVNSKQLIESLKADGLPKELSAHICLMNAVNDMKKFNNGFGPTALIDDTVVGIYICFYNYFLLAGKLVDDSTAVSESTSHRSKKMAKRDVFPLTIEMLKMLKRDVDQILKDSPNIFNEFVELNLGPLNEMKDDIKTVEEKEVMNSAMEEKEGTNSIMEVEVDINNLRGAKDNIKQGLEEKDVVEIPAEVNKDYTLESKGDMILKSKDVMKVNKDDIEFMNVEANDVEANDVEMNNHVEDNHIEVNEMEVHNDSTEPKDSEVATQSQDAAEAIHGTEVSHGPEEEAIVTSPVNDNETVLEIEDVKADVTEIATEDAEAGDNVIVLTTADEDKVAKAQVDDGEPEPEEPETKDTIDHQNSVTPIGSPIAIEVSDEFSTPMAEIDMTATEQINGATRGLLKKLNYTKDDDDEGKSIEVNSEDGNSQSMSVYSISSDSSSPALPNVDIVEEAQEVVPDEQPELNQSEPIPTDADTLGQEPKEQPLVAEEQPLVAEEQPLIADEKLQQNSDIVSDTEVTVDNGLIVGDEGVVEGKTEESNKPVQKSLVKVTKKRQVEELPVVLRRSKRQRTKRVE